MKIAKVILLVLTLCLALSAFVGCGSSDSGMTVGQKNALKKAELYLRTSSFSRESLITQLEFEGFEKVVLQKSSKSSGVSASYAFLRDFLYFLVKISSPKIK